MNFWRASILPLLFAAAAFLGLYALKMQTERGACVLEQWEAAVSVEFNSPGMVSEPDEGDDCLNGVDEEHDDLFQYRKRSRKCWRPESYLAIALVPIKSPAEASRPDYVGREYHPSEPARSDLLFIAGGYIRLFQKG